MANGKVNAPIEVMCGYCGEYKRIKSYSYSYSNSYKYIDCGDCDIVVRFFSHLPTDFIKKKDNTTPACDYEPITKKLKDLGY